MKDFFASLSRGTKITLITCGSFLILTMLILIFLMLCPIQQSSSANHVNDALVVTTVSQEDVSDTETTVSTRSTRKTTVANRKTTTTRTTTKSYVVTDAPEDSYWQEPIYEEDSDADSKPDDSYVYTYPAETQLPTTTNSPVVTSPESETPVETIPTP